jgi:arylsulfatase A-like enzyme
MGLNGWALGAQDDWVARESVAAMRAVRPVLTFVTFPEFGLVQQSGIYSTETASTILRGIDRDVGQIVTETKREGTFRETLFVVTSGRAFEPARTSLSRQSLTNAIVAAGGEPTYTVGDGAAFIGLKDPLQAQPVAQALEGAGAHGVDAVYYKSGTGTSVRYVPQFIDPSVPTGFSGACSALLATLASANSPDVVVIYRPYTGLKSTGSRGARLSFGLQWPTQSIPLIISGHGTYAGRVSSFPARLVDIAPTIETALGLPTAGDGTALTDALYGTTAQTRAHETVLRSLSKEVSALRNR